MTCTNDAKLQFSDEQSQKKITTIIKINTMYNCYERSWPLYILKKTRDANIHWQ